MTNDRALFSPAQRERAARRFKLLSEPVRLQLLDQLHQNGEMTVTELVEATDVPQATASKHLGLLAQENLVRRRKDGLYAYYRISDPTLAALCLLIRERLRDEERQHRDESS